MDPARLDPPRLLFLAYAFPPSRAIGAVRTWNLAKQLARRGWAVEVVTFDPDLLSDPDPNVDIGALCEEFGIRRRLTGHGFRFLLRGWLKPRWLWDRSRAFSGAFRRGVALVGFDVAAGWAGPARRACRGILPGEVDLVLASGPPFSSFGLAARLARRLGVPYVLDYRDLWSQSPEKARKPSRLLVGREGRLVGSAAAVINVSPLSAACLSAGFSVRSAPVVITNGFDEEDLAGVEANHFGECAIVYAGSFDDNHRQADPIIAAVKRANSLRAAGTVPIRFHYYGPTSQYVAQVSQRLGAREFVVDHGRVPRAEALAAAKGAAAAAVITTINEEGTVAERGIVTGKLFEALGLGTRVMLIAPAGSDAAEIVNRAGAGRHFRGSQIGEMAEWLAKLDSIREQPAPARVADYSWETIGARADDLLRACITESRREGALVAAR